MTANPLDPLTAKRLRLGEVPLTRAAIEDWQLRRLRRTLAWARARSPFYRRHLAMLPKAPVASLDDLARLPFTTAADLQADPLRFVCVSQSAIARVVTLETSGTTGAPKRLFFTRRDQNITLDFFRHGLRQMMAAGDAVLILLPGDKPGSVGDLLARAVTDNGGRPVLAGFVRDVAATAGLARSEAVGLIVGIPVQILALARHWRQQGWGKGAIGAALLCTDNVPMPVIRELEAIWGCAVFQDWGMTEMGFGGGVDCVAHRGYHLQEGDFLFEVIDPASGRPLPAGATGEIVFTTLTRSGMPLIRYRTGDLSRFLDGPCPCGSVLRRLDRIGTRKTGAVVVGGDEISMASLDDALFGLPGLADFSADMTRDRAGGTLRVTATPVAATEAQALPLAIEAALLTLPAVRAASDRGELVIAVELAGGTIPTDGRGKRTIRRDAEP